MFFAARSATAKSGARQNRECCDRQRWSWKNSRRAVPFSILRVPLQFNSLASRLFAAGQREDRRRRSARGRRFLAHVARLRRQVVPRVTRLRKSVRRESGRAQRRRRRSSVTRRGASATVRTRASRARDDRTDYRALPHAEKGARGADQRGGHRASEEATRARLTPGHPRPRVARRLTAAGAREGRPPDPHRRGHGEAAKQELIQANSATRRGDREASTAPAACSSRT